MKLLRAVLKLMRFKPVISWTVCGFVLALSVAFYETGALLNLDLVIASFVAVLLIQGVLSHAVNDLCDEEVDKDSNINETGRTKVLISGLATRYDLLSLALVALFVSLMIMIQVYNRLGCTIILFAVVGFYAAVGYSVSPLKLGWRPFSEWTVVYPVITTLVIAVNYLATEHISFLALLVGTTHAMYNIRWFMDSRMVDIESDSKHGKITTPIFMNTYVYRIRNDVSDFYTTLMSVWMCLLFFCFSYYNSLFIIPSMVLFGYGYICALNERRTVWVPHTSWLPSESVQYIRPCSYYVKSRLIGMRLTVINTVIMSLWLVTQKVYIL